jgi:hypothetical protein
MKSARAVPNVQVYARHRPDCKLAGFWGSDFKQAVEAAMTTKKK